MIKYTHNFIITLLILDIENSTVITNSFTLFQDYKLYFGDYNCQFKSPDTMRGNSDRNNVERSDI